MNNKKRYAIVMAISVIFNTIFYLCAHFFHLPIWLDLQGTAFAAMVLEPTAGLLVGLINNFIEAIFFYDVSSIIYFAVSASVALIVGLYLRHNNKIQPKRIIPTIILVVIATSFISAILSMWRSGGIPDSKWELYFFTMAKDLGVPTFFSTFFGTFVLKIGDALVSTLLIAILYFILPKSLRYTPVQEEVILEDKKEKNTNDIKIEFTLDDDEE